MRHNFPYDSVFFAQLPKRVNYVVITAVDDLGNENPDTIIFSLSEGNGSQKRWTCSNVYTNCGQPLFTNGGVAKYLKDYLRELQEHDEYANISFHYMREDGELIGNWDWSEVSGPSRKYLVWESQP